MAADDSVSSEPGFALWRAAMRWQRDVNASLRGLALTHTQYLVLGATADAQRDTGDAVSQRQVAEHAGLDEATASVLIRKLEQRDLLNRDCSVESRGALRVIVTSRGRAALQKAAPLMAAACERFWNNPAHSRYASPPTADATAADSSPVSSRRATASMSR